MQIASSDFLRDQGKNGENPLWISIDTCRKCGYRGVIYSKCPVCGSDDILRMRRITGYLTGSLESWNSAKQAEERDRVKHR